MNTQQYLAAVKAKLSISTDYKLAKALGVTRQLASKYANGKNIPGPLVAFRIAEILGDQPSAVIADLEAERAERGGKDAEAQEWHDIAKRLAACILLAVGSGTFSNADARLASASQVDHTAHRIGAKRRRRSSVIQQSAAA